MAISNIIMRIIFDYILEVISLQYIYSYCIRDATDLKPKVNQKHDTMVAMLICTLSTELQISMGRIGKI